MLSILIDDTSTTLYIRPARNIAKGIIRVQILRRTVRNQHIEGLWGLQTLSYVSMAVLRFLDDLWHTHVGFINSLKILYGLDLPQDCGLAGATSGAITLGAVVQEHLLVTIY